MTGQTSARDGMLTALPHLRAFAISLTDNIDHADDLVQDTLVRAITHLDRFTPGTNLQAWLFTILRNQFYSEYRKRKREVEDPDHVIAGLLAVPPEQDARVEFGELRAALAKLPAKQREALLLIGAEGLTYEAAARICNIQIGTMKSRVFRARAQLAELMGMSGREDLIRSPAD
jgi:RNA polymerase sigma-70 factor (ECF subfamily)